MIMMGVQTTVFIIRVLFILLNCLIFIRFINSESIDTLCYVKGCNCVKRAAPWWDISCNLDKQQDLKLESHHVPREISEITINGGHNIIISTKTFKNLAGFRFFRLENIDKIIIEKETFYNISAPSLIIQIINCDHLEIKTGAFEIKQSGLQIEIVHCTTVAIERTAFDLLDNATFKNIKNLILATETFEFKNQRKVFNVHGPPSIISFDNVSIEKLPQHTFRSALAKIDIRNSKINEVYANAFYSIQISAICIINTVIDTIKIDAFSHGHTYIMDLEFTNCSISTIEKKGIRAGITNLTIQHSRIGDIQSGAINISVAKVDIIYNEIYNLYESGIILQNWNRINFTKNIIENMYSNFLITPKYPEIDIEYLIYVDNDVQNVEANSLSFLSELDDKIIKYSKNFFNRTCYCLINDWIIELLNSNKTTKINQIRENSFCIVNDLLADCFQLLSPGIININNFTKLVCNNNSNTVKCEPYHGETKIVNITTTTSKMLSKTNQQRLQNTNWLTLIISCTAVLIFLIIATLTIMLIKGSRWLKRKGYFRKIQYNNQNEQSNLEDDENTIETVDENHEQADVTEDLTLDLLQDLSKKLDDPNTHQAASEMIEQLYQKFIRNNNETNQQQPQQQDDETHLYEELGNLVDNCSTPNKNENDSKTILKIMEERFNLILNDIDDDDDDDDDNNGGNYERNDRQNRPALVGEYSEPSDAAVHLYSELKQQNRDSEDNNNDEQDTLKSRTSTNMAFRPLPDKPGSSKMI